MRALLPWLLATPLLAGNVLVGEPEDAWGDASLAGLTASRRELYRGGPGSDPETNRGRGAGRKPLGTAPSSIDRTLDPEQVGDLLAATETLLHPGSPPPPERWTSLSLDVPEVRARLQARAAACAARGLTCPSPAVIRTGVGLLSDKRTVQASDLEARRRAWIWTAHDRVLREVRTRGQDPEKWLPDPAWIRLALEDPDTAMAGSMAALLAASGQDLGLHLAPWPSPIR